MTREEIINAQAGQDTDLLVADNVLKLDSVGWNERFFHHRANFSTDIKAAQEIINTLAKEPFAWHIESINTEGEKVQWWACLWGDMPDGSITEFSAQAETIPLAICRVALLRFAI